MKPDCASVIRAATVSSWLMAAWGCSDGAPPTAPLVLESLGESTAARVKTQAQPRAVFRTTPADQDGTIAGGSPLSVQFNLCQSRPENEDDDLKYTYDFDGDGAVDYFGHCRASHAYENRNTARACQPARVCVGDRRPGGEVCRTYEVCVEGEGERGPSRVTRTFEATGLPVVVPAGGFQVVTIPVSGSGLVEKVTVSVHVLRAPSAERLMMFLFGAGTLAERPDGYGTSCGAPTVFDDDAAVAIDSPAAIPPFVGAYRPVDDFSALEGEMLPAGGGNLILVISNDSPINDATLVCFALTVTTTE